MSDLNESSAPPLQLLDLNDDCLIKILSYISPLELVNVAETNKELKNIVRSVFATECFNKQFKLEIHIQNVFTNAKRKWTLKTFLQNFGDLIGNISVDFSSNQPMVIKSSYKAKEYIFELLCKYVSDLDSLELINFHQPLYQVYNVSLNYPHFQKFIGEVSILRVKLNNCFFWTSLPFLNIKELHLKSCAIKLKNIEIPSLESIQITSMGDVTNLDLDTTFFKQNPVIKSIGVRNCEHDLFTEVKMDKL